MISYSKFFYFFFFLLLLLVLTVFLLLFSAICGLKTEGRVLNLKNPLIHVTDKPDCITYDSDADYPRAVNPTKKTTSFYYIRSLFEKNEKLTDIYCPLPECNQVWDWTLVATVANLTAEENLRYTLERDRRKNGNENMKKCPKCSINIVRPEDLTMFR
ncbi:hypothetical protein RFI_13119 [Reticulomyxa filosa]|uniref:Uncharacterized protein n=1 Tax=Reticulomyxa filosa TaxID=46433 RepID=X6NFC4_RETFI|nr:hypothetical protein RFI_13119 [Reticulomyxa filosa]|eukprot:ETO24042.1 hypothetical protein RFI_13119 [Reticulomyxa filosa]